MDLWLLAAPLMAGGALLFALFIARSIRRQKTGTDRMREIAKAISDGARAFLRSQYRILGICTAIVSLGIGLGLSSWLTALCFLVGAGFSVLSGLFGMRVATEANVRTANAAMEHGMQPALHTAFSGADWLGFALMAAMLVCMTLPGKRRRSES